MKKKSNYILAILVFLNFYSCEKNNNLNEMWDKAEVYYQNKNFDDSVIILNKIINMENTSEDLKVKSLFLISEIYLNEYKEYDISLSFLDQILNFHQGHNLHKRALFTKAYINANYLDAYTDAIVLYNLFLESYPNDELISSVNYELEELNKFQEQINELIKNSNF